MGAMGRYIDSLPVEAKDRVIQGQQWIGGVFADFKGGGCLIGHAEDFASCLIPQFFTPTYPCESKSGYFTPKPALSFDKAYPRWGQRLIRAIKARAAKPFHQQVLDAGPEAGYTACLT